MGERYELLKVLGYGSYSAVVLALDKTTGEKVRSRWVSEPRVCAGGAELRMGSLVVVAGDMLRLSAPETWYSWCSAAARSHAGMQCFQLPEPRTAARLPLPLPTNRQVALKRVGDVLQSPDQCKRVLREICILRRL